MNFQNPLRIQTIRTLILFVSSVSTLTDYKVNKNKSNLHCNLDNKQGESYLGLKVINLSNVSLNKVQVKLLEKGI